MSGEETGRERDDPRDIADLRVAVARLSGRISALERRLDDQLHQVQARLDEMKTAIDGLVSKAAFAPVQIIVYGVLGVIVLAVMLAVLSMVLRVGKFWP